MAHASVLLVEPSADNRDMYAEYLRARDFEPILTDTADDALRRAPDVDLIVTGIRLPGSFDGIELIKRLRQDDRTKTKPIIVLTACVFEPERSRAEQVGCDVFLAKPCLPNVLVAEALRLLTLSRSLREDSEREHQRAAKTRRKSDALIARSCEIQRRPRKKR